MPSSKKTFTVTDQRSQSNADRQAWRNRSAEERLDAVEQLRIEAGKFLYEYPVRNTQSDFENFLRLLESNRVEYMIVGGYAVAFHGFPRFTKDIDIFFAGTRENSSRLQAALVAFGFQKSTVPLESLEKPGALLVIGVEPVRIDLVNQIDGITFDEARPNVVRGRYGNVEVTFIGMNDLIRNKRSTGRTRDLGDVEELS